MGRFFAANIKPCYISHSELQGPRALDTDRWQPGIQKILTRELKERICALQKAETAREYPRPVFSAKRAGDLLGLGLVSFFTNAPVPYAILEDIVVAEKDRDREIGNEMLEWAIAEAKSLGCVRMFLESGVNNQDAHEFFKRKSFSVCSIVMKRDL